MWQQSFTIVNSTNSSLITLSQSNYNVNESTGFVTITVNRTGDLSIPVSVDYATDDTGSSDVCSDTKYWPGIVTLRFWFDVGHVALRTQRNSKDFHHPDYSGLLYRRP